MTQTLAEQLGTVFHSPGFWLTRQALWMRAESGADAPAGGDGTPPC